VHYPRAMLFPLRLPAQAALVALLSLVLFGCGGDDGADETSTSSTSTTTSETDTQGSKPSKSGAKDLEKELMRTLNAKDCKEVNSLNPSTRPYLDTEERCEGLRLFKDFDVIGSEEYGDGAIVDLISEEAGINSSAVFVKEVDDSFSLVYIDNLRAGKTVGTKPAKEFDGAAAKAATALREEDCDAFIKVSYVRRGLAVGERDDVCDRLEAFGFADLAEILPDEAPVLTGGNAEFAFYTLGENVPRLVLIMAHQAPEDELFTTDFPKGGAEYGLVDVFPIAEPEE